MADYISKYTGAQIDLSTASGSTTTGNISASGDLYLVGNDIYGSGNQKRITLGATNTFVGNINNIFRFNNFFSYITINSIL